LGGSLASPKQTEILLEESVYEGASSPKRDIVLVGRGVEAKNCRAQLRKKGNTEDDEEPNVREGFTEK